MEPEGHRSLIKTAMEILEADQNPISQIVVVDKDGVSAKVLREGKWIDGRFSKYIRVDQPTHLQGLQGQQHASVYGRNRRQELVVVNLDGTGSHGTKERLSAEDAEALKAQGFKIRDDRMVEWIGLQTDHGERVIGRLVSLAWVAQSVASDAPVLSAADAWSAVQDRRTVSSE